MATETGSYITVRLEGGCPWGFRLQGGAGSGKLLTISKVRKRSKSFNKLRADDVIIECNGKPCDNLTYDEVMRMADAGGPNLALRIYRVREEKPRKGKSLEIFKSIADSPSDDRHKRVREEEVTTEYRSKITKQTEGHTIKPFSLLPRLPKPFFKMDKEHTATDDIPVEQVEIPAESWNKIEETPTETMDTHTTAEVNGIVQENLKQSSESERFSSEGQIPQQKLEDATQKSVSKEVTTEGDAVISTITEKSREVDGNTETNVIKQEKKTVAPGSIAEESSTLIETKSGELNGPSHLFEVLKSEQNTTAENSSFTSLSNTVTSSSSVIASEVSSFVTKTISEQDQSSLGMNSIFTGVIRDSIELNPKIYQPSLDMDDLSLFTHRKKMFSSSSFYEEPNAIYPTVEEQVELCRKIADSLSADTNKRSRGANMFFKRVNKSQKWIHEGPDPIGSDSDPFEGYDLSTPDPSKSSYVRVSKGPTKLKLILDPRQIQDMVKLRSSGQDINEHNVISPDICLGIVKDLNSPTGKGAILFAKRKKKSEEWVVDEEKVKAHLADYSHYDSYHQQKDAVQNQRVKMIHQTPWDAALHSPYGSCDGAFINVHPDTVAETVIRVAEEKVRTPAPVPSKPQPSLLPAKSRKQPSPFKMDPYRPRAPRGWSGTPDASSIHSDIELPPSYTAPQPSKSMSNIAQYAAAPKYNFQNNFNNTAKAWTGESYSSFNFRPVKPPSLLI